MTDYAVKVTVRNARILRRMRELGIKSNTELSRKSGVNIGTVGTIINLKKAPLGKNGQWLPGVENIAGVLLCDPEDLFSDTQRTLELSANSSEIEMSEQQVALLVSPDPEESSWAKLEVQKLLTCLNEREQYVVKEISGGAHFHEVGAEIDLSIERVRQIYTRSLRKMNNRAHKQDKEFSGLMLEGELKPVPNPNWKPRKQRELEELEELRAKYPQYYFPSKDYDL